jgi:hypothetical protein
MVLDLAFNWPVGEGRFNMTEHDKNDLKVPRFDSLSFGMKGAALFQALHNTSDSRQVG